MNGVGREKERRRISKADSDRTSRGSKSSQEKSGEHDRGEMLTMARRV
jgi:hypothetical protein